METRTILSGAVLLLIFVRIYLSIRKNRRKPRLLASVKFSEAFIDEIQDLSQGKGDAFEFLRGSFSKHERAYRKFRTCLKGKTLQKLDEAWGEYFYGSEDDNSHSCPEQYFAAGNISLAREKRKLALKRIQKLLSFAQR
jgi:hypothetical protein